jgi:hypothetical protein
LIQPTDSGLIQPKKLGNQISDEFQISTYRFSLPEFQNPNFFISLRIFLSSGLIQPKKLGNQISDEGAMSFFW